MLLIAALYAFSISSAIITVTYVENDAITLLVTCFALTAYFSFLLYSLKFLKIIGGLTLAALFFFFLTLLVTNKQAAFMLDMKNLYELIVGKATFTNRYDTVLLIFICLIVSIVSSVFIVQRCSVAVAGLIGLIIFSIEWMTEYYYSQSSFYIFLAVILILTFRNMNARSQIIFNLKKNKKIQNQNNGIFTLVCTPFFVILLILSMVFAQGETINKDAIYSKFSGNNISSIEEFLMAFTAPPIFDFSTTGFGNDGELGGDVKENDTPVMNVQTEDKKLYLSGKKSRIYDGRKWVNENNNYFSSSEENLEETSEIKFLQENMPGKYFEKNSVLVYPLKRTVTLFSPSTLVSFSDKKVKFNDMNDIISDTYYRNGEDYRSTYVSLSKNKDAYILLEEQNSSEKRTFLYNGEEYDMNMPKGVTKGFYKQQISEISSIDSFSVGNDFYQLRTSLTSLDIYANSVYSEYTLLPDTLPKRVKELSDEITKDIKPDNHYDKILAFRNYLRDYEYTFSPGDVPKGRDFVDYFLFEGKKGYCSYFASALAVMCRTQSIPCRYVEGFYAENNTGEKATVNVKNQNAHSWVEVYFEGTGWVTFESTPPYFIAESQVVPAPPSQTGSTPPEESTSSENSSPETVSSNESSQTNESSTASKEDSSIQQAVPPILIKTNLLPVILLLISAFMIILTALLIYRYKRYNRDIGKLSYKSLMTRCFGYIVKLASIDTKPYEEHETALQFAKRCDGQYIFNNIDLVMIATLYSEACYSNTDKLGEKEQLNAKKIMFNYYVNMKKQVFKNHIGIKTFFFSVMLVIDSFTKKD